MGNLGLVQHHSACSAVAREEKGGEGPTGGVEGMVDDRDCRGLLTTEASDTSEKESKATKSSKSVIRYC